MSGQKPGDATTQFQLHKSQHSTRSRTLFDYSEFRLKRCIEKLKDEKQKEMLRGVLKQYKLGLVAIAWRRGQPVWLNVTKETGKV